MKKNDAFEKIQNRINKQSILFFDMDGTLLDTNFANYLSYKKAIQSVIKTVNDITYNPDERFNRGLIKSVISNLTEIEYEKIIQQKEKYYIEHLPYTKLNNLIEGILLKYSKTNKTVLVTNCREERAIITLNYHRLTDNFSNIFYRQKSKDGHKINKYKNAITKLNISAESVIIFENEKSEIDDAIKAGVNEHNIIKI